MRTVTITVECYGSVFVVRQAGDVLLLQTDDRITNAVKQEHVLDLAETNELIHTLSEMRNLIWPVSAILAYDDDDDDEDEFLHPADRDALDELKRTVGSGPPPREVDEGFFSGGPDLPADEY